MKGTLSSRDWFGKVSAALPLGFTLALGVSGLLAWALGVNDTFFSTRGQLTMWSMAPVWAGVVSLCFLFRTTLRAWGWLLLANLLVWMLLLAGGRL